MLAHNFLENCLSNHYATPVTVGEFPGFFFFDFFFILFAIFWGGEE